MANLTLRVLSRAGDTTKNAPLTNVEIDQNFINIDEELALKANINSPALTGTPTAPTAPAGTNTTQIATTAFVNSAIGTGNAATATKLQTARTISLSGGVSGSASFDGSGNVSISTVVNGKLDYFELPLQGGALSWYKIAELTTNIGFGANGLVLYVSGIGRFGDNKPGVDIVQVSTRGTVSVDVYEVVPRTLDDTTYGYVNNASTGKTELWVRRAHYNYKTGVAVSMAVDATYGNLGNSTTEPAGITYVSKRNFYHSGNINTANAGTATKLQTARAITIGNTGKAFDGSANVSWSLAEIGAAAATHTHTIADVTNLQTTLDGKANKPTAPITITGNYTVGSTDYWIICKGTGQITITLPSASANIGRVINFKTISNQPVVSNASNVVSLYSEAVSTSILPAAAGAWCTLSSDGTNWIIVAASSDYAV